MRRHRLLLSLAAVLAMLMVSSPANAGPGSGSGPTAGPATVIWRVSVAPGSADAETLMDRGFDVTEAREGNSLFVVGERWTGLQLRLVGYHSRVEQVLPASAPADVTIQADTYFGGYHTVESQQAHLTSVAAARPDLATVVDYGDSWRKATGRAGGFDLRAICLTHKVSGDCALSPNSTKPRFLLMSQIHAREIATGELTYRWIDFLVANYGSNAAVTNLLDTTEVWVVPTVNPDGVSVVQTGSTRPLLRRKNLDNTFGTCGGTTSLSYGIDLNRNASSHWGGASRNACSETFQGPRAASEPEIASLQNLFRQLFADQRGTSDSSAAPLTTRGIMITLHSYASLNLFPWGFANRAAPNDSQLRAIANRFRTFNGYPAGRPGELLYNASGTTDDWSYGELGIASFTIEVGPNSGTCSGFTPAFSCVDTNFWPRHQPLFMFAGSIAGAPYQFASSLT